MEYRQLFRHTKGKQFSRYGCAFTPAFGRAVRVFGLVTQGYGDTASKKRSPAAFTLGWYISPFQGLDPWPFEPLRSIQSLRCI